MKALSEASGELRELLWGIPRQVLLRAGPPPDEDWSLGTLALHLLDVERGVYRQFTAILMLDEPEIPHVDLDDVPPIEAVSGLDTAEVVDEFGWARRRTTALLWDLHHQEWARAGLHPYRGKVTVTDLARDLYQHDLEHLWQARRMAGALVGVR